MKKRVLKGTVNAASRRGAAAKTNPGQQNKTARRPQIILDQNAEYGPAMAKLTDTRKRFVLAFIRTGYKDQRLAAIHAGIGGTDANSASEACHLMQDRRILDAIQEETENLFRGVTPECHHELVAMMRDKKVAAGIRLKAIDILMDRSGWVVAQRINITHEHRLEDMSGDELLAKLVELRAKNNLLEYQPVPESGFVAEKLDVLDGEFVELKEAA